MAHKKIILKKDDEYFVLNPDDIVRCKSNVYKTIFFINSGEQISFISKTMKEYESLLGGFGFIRIHNSHLVNINFIKSFTFYKNENYMIMKDGAKLPISRRKKSVIMNFFLDEKVNAEQKA